MLRYTDLCRPKKEGLVEIFDNVVIPKLKNMAKSMAVFSDYPAILFTMFRRGSISDPSGVDMAPPCRSVAILLNREAGVFFRESPPSALRVESVYNHSKALAWLRRPSVYGRQKWRDYGTTLIPNRSNLPWDRHPTRPRQNLGRSKFYTLERFKVCLSGPVWSGLVCTY